MRFQVVEDFYEENAQTDDSDCEEYTNVDEVIRCFSQPAPQPKFDSNVSEINYLLNGLRRNKHTLTGSLRDGGFLEVIVCVSGCENRIKFVIDSTDLNAINLKFDRVVVAQEMRPMVWEFLRSLPLPCELEFFATTDFLGPVAPTTVSRDETIKVLSKFHTISVSDSYFAFAAMNKDFSLLESLGSLTIRNSREQDPAAVANLVIMLDFLPPRVEWLTISNLLAQTVFETLCRLVQRHAHLRYIIIKSRMNLRFERKIIREFIQKRKIHVQWHGYFTPSVNFSESRELQTMLYLIDMNSESCFSSVGSDVKRLLVTLMFGKYPSASFLKPKAASVEINAIH